LTASHGDTISYPSSSAVSFDGSAGLVVQSNEMTQWVAGIDEWILDDADQYPGEGNLDGGRGRLERVGDGGKLIALVDEVATAGMDVDETASVTSDRSVEHPSATGDTFIVVTGRIVSTVRTLRRSERISAAQESSPPNWPFSVFKHDPDSSLTAVRSLIKERPTILVDDRAENCAC
jgi:hypothetical protein